MFVPFASNITDGLTPFPLPSPEVSSVIVPAAIVIFTVPLYSKKFFPVCFVASSKLFNVNVYLISFSPVVSFVENVGVDNDFAITVFAFASPSTETVISLVANVLFSTPVRYLSVAIKSAVTFLFVLSIFMFSTFQTGSTTSTIIPVSCPSPVVGSSIPIVIVFAKFPFVSVSVTMFSGNANVITPL